MLEVTCTDPSSLRVLGGDIFRTVLVLGTDGHTSLPLGFSPLDCGDTSVNLELWPFRRQVGTFALRLFVFYSALAQVLFILMHAISMNY